MPKNILVIGAGIGGLTAGALLAKTGNASHFSKHLRNWADAQGNSIGINSSTLPVPRSAWAWRAAASMNGFSGSSESRFRSNHWKR